MSDRLPFNKRERKRLCYQDGFEYRSRNDWGMGNLPAPWAEGDIVELVGPRPMHGYYDLLQDMEGPFFVVVAGFSIDEGDAWYFRVTDGSGGNLAGNSDRLHFAPVARRSKRGWRTSGDIDDMRPFRLVDTSDPEGLSERVRLLAEGWELPTCVDRGCLCDCHPEADDV